MAAKKPTKNKKLKKAKKMPNVRTLTQFIKIDR